MLVDTKRAPLYPGFRSAESMKTRSQLRHPVARSSFFRTYATSTKITVVKKPPALYTYRAELINRRTEKDAIPTASSAVIQQQTKPRAIAQGRLQHSAVTGATTSGGIDIRLLRAKSARSGAYLQRYVGGRNKISAVAASLAGKAVRNDKAAKIRRRNVLMANRYKNSNINPLSRRPFRQVSMLAYVATPHVPARTLQIRRKVWRLCQKPNRLTKRFLK